MKNEDGEPNLISKNIKKWRKKEKTKINKKIMKEITQHNIGSICTCNIEQIYFLLKKTSKIQKKYWFFYILRLENRFLKFITNRAFMQNLKKIGWKVKWLFIIFKFWLLPEYFDIFRPVAQFIRHIINILITERNQRNKIFLRLFFHFFSLLTFSFLQFPSTRYFIAIPKKSI